MATINYHETIDDGPLDRWACGHVTVEPSVDGGGRVFLAIHDGGGYDFHSAHLDRADAVKVRDALTEVLGDAPAPAEAEAPVPTFEVGDRVVVVTPMAGIEDGQPMWNGYMDAGEHATVVRGPDSDGDYVLCKADGSTGYCRPAGLRPAPAEPEPEPAPTFAVGDRVVVTDTDSHAFSLGTIGTVAYVEPRPVGSGARGALLDVRTDEYRFRQSLYSDQLRLATGDDFLVTIDPRAIEVGDRIRVVGGDDDGVEGVVCDVLDEDGDVELLDHGYTYVERVPGDFGNFGTPADAVILLDRPEREAEESEPEPLKVGDFVTGYDAKGVLVEVFDGQWIGGDCLVAWYEGENVAGQALGAMLSNLARA